MKDDKVLFYSKPLFEHIGPSPTHSLIQSNLFTHLVTQQVSQSLSPAIRGAAVYLHMTVKRFYQFRTSQIFFKRNKYPFLIHQHLFSFVLFSFLFQLFDLTPTLSVCFICQSFRFYGQFVIVQGLIKCIKHATLSSDIRKAIMSVIFI